MLLHPKDMKQSDKIISKSKKGKPAKKHVISTPGELREVKWLIKEGVYKSVEDYINRTSELLYGNPKFV